MRGLYLIVVLLISTAYPRAAEFPFTGEHRIEESENQNRVSLVDLDRDQDLDVLIIGSPRGGSGLTSVRWYENKGQAKQFVKRIIDDSLMEGDDIAVGDIDGDGDLDVVGSGDGRHARPNGGLQWWENLFKSKAWENHKIHHNGPRGGDIELGDLDGDGDLDVVLSGTIGEKSLMVWYQNLDSRGQTWSAYIPIAERCSRPVLLMDYDGDKDIDIVTKCKDTEFAWFENAGGTWNKKIITRGDKSIPFHLRSRDLNRDGKPDIIVGARQLITVYLNIGEARFVPEQILDTGSLIEKPLVDASDVDQDGDMDILVARPDGNKTLMWFENTDGGFEQVKEHQIKALHGHPRYLLVGDLDGDGDDDLVSQGRHRWPVLWFENTVKQRK